MLQRPAWSVLYERDIDLVLLDLLHSAPAFRARLLAAVAADVPILDPERDYLGAWHSVIDEHGHESDLEAEWRMSDGSVFALLIEDKLAARCQPDQATRYLARAERYRIGGRATYTRTLLVAPAWYPSKHADDTAPFERHLAIEDVAAWCDAGVAGDRAPYIAALLRHALARHAPSAVGSDTTSEHLTTVYAALREAIAAQRSDLTITSKAEWVYFKFPGQRTNVWLRYRLYDHWVELVLAQKVIPEAVAASVFSDTPLPGASLATRGKTETAIWYPTPELDLSADLSRQRSQLLAAVAATEALRSWYVAHAEALHSGKHTADA